MIHLPAIATPAKPLEGHPCNGCGLCCHLSLCDAAKLVLPDAVAPCPFMELHGGQFRCGLVMAEIEHGLPPRLQNWLGIGLGCSMTDDEDSPNRETA